MEPVCRLFSSWLIPATGMLHSVYIMPTKCHGSFDKLAVKKLERNIYQVDISVKNSRVTPSISAIASQKKLHRADRIKVEGKDVKLLASGRLTDRFRGITQKVKTQEDFLWIESGVPGFGKINYRLLVKGKGSINIIYDSLKGGTYTKTATLK